MNLRLALIDCFLASFVLISCAPEGKPEQVAEAFLSAINRGDYETARKHSSKETLPLIDFLENISQLAMQENAGKKESNPVSNIRCTKYDEKRCVCIYCCDTNGEEADIELIKVRNEWKAHLPFNPYDEIRSLHGDNYDYYDEDSVGWDDRSDVIDDLEAETEE